MPLLTPDRSESAISPMNLKDTIAEHTTSVFLNLDHFAEEYVFESNAAEDIDFVGIFDRAHEAIKNTPDANVEQFDALLTVSVATVALFQAAASDFEQDGWISIAGQRFSIVGEAERDSAMVTLMLATSKVKTLRRTNPHK